MTNSRYNGYNGAFDRTLSGLDSERSLSTQEPIGSMYSSLFSESRLQYLATEGNDETMPSSRRESALFIESLRGRDSDSDIEQRLLNTFRAFDADGDGFISPAELRYAMNLLGEVMTEEEAEDMIREVDLDKDGKLSYWEFIRVIEDS